MLCGLLQGDLFEPLLLLLLSLTAPSFASGGFSPSDGAGEGEGPVVRVAQGALRGRRIQRPEGSPLRTIYAFEGVPYARAPIGSRRFKDPEEHESWSGIRNATDYGSICIQKKRSTGVVSGQEDCLYLNIYSAKPPATWDNVKQPVIVYIHGGAFIMWSGNLEHIRVDPLLRKGIIFVTLNYRLGVMGFLNTEDSEAPGNAGLKDQNMALRWVRDNIAAFGGDPTQVTIMGESAGGASVHFHMLSSLSRGLFHRAISVSGTVLPKWTHVQRPKERAAQLRKRFASKCSDLPDDVIVPCLQRIPAEDLVFNQYDVPLEQYQNYFLKSTFLPSVEVPIPGKVRFLTDKPEKLLKEGQFSKVPFMTGFTSSEGIVFLRFADLIANTTRWSEVDEHFEDIFRWEMPLGVPKTREAARQVRNFYLGNRTLSVAHENMDTLERFVQLCTDIFIGLGTATSAKLMVDHGAPVYVYQFSRDGPIAYLKDTVFNASHIPGVMHGDDMAYLFDFIVRSTGEPREVPLSEQPLRERQAEIFANFVKFGNPTPNGSNLLHWPLFTSQKESYMDMNVNLTVNDHVLDKRIAFWRRLATDMEMPSEVSSTYSPHV